MLEKIGISNLRVIKKYYPEVFILYIIFITN